MSALPPPPCRGTPGSLPRMMSYRGFALPVALLLTAMIAGGDDATPPRLTPRERNRHLADALATQLARDVTPGGDRLVRPGLVANRAAGTVTVFAESIHLAPDAPVEFILIAEASGKEYEALAVSFARPSDIHDALDFIGVRPGQGIDPAHLRFWPKGDHVRIDVRVDETDDGQRRSRDVPAEQLVSDKRTGAALPETGFVFAGSRRVPDTQPAGTGTVYAADVFSPNSIVSVYNEPGTVLDVPRRAPQQEVYSYQVPNPAHPLPDAQVIRIKFTAVRPPGGACVRDMVLRVSSAAHPGDVPTYTLEPVGQTGAAPTNAAAIRAALDGIVRGGSDAFVTVIPDDGLTLADVQAVATFVDSIEGEQGARIEPPPAGHPYFRSFLPDERHRSREGRPLQPWELYVGVEGAVVTGTLVRIEETWAGADTRPVYKEAPMPVRSTAELDEALTQPDTPHVALVFAEPTLAYGTFRSFIAPLLKRNMILYVFLPLPETTRQDAPQP